MTMAAPVPAMMAPMTTAKVPAAEMMSAEVAAVAEVMAAMMTSTHVVAVMTTVVSAVRPGVCR
ncbi:MAG TPA: hypothetical protein VHB22_13435 [Hyphomicrobium sp.]|nr:hypothetical protein [Hyphomicrobium sp.]